MQGLRYFHFLNTILKKPDNKALVDNLILNFSYRLCYYKLFLLYIYHYSCYQYLILLHCFNLFAFF